MNNDMMGVQWLAAKGINIPEELPYHGELSLNFTTSTEDGESSELLDSIGEDALADLWDLMRDEPEAPAPDERWDFL